MFKSLAGRALIPVGLAVTGFVVVCFFLLYAAIKNIVTRDSISHAANLADTVLKSTHYAMLKSDRETLGSIIHNISEQKGVEHIRIFNKSGMVNASSRPEEIGRQVDKRSEGCINCHQSSVPSTRLGTMEQARRYSNSSGIDVMAITVPIYNEPQCSNAACHVHLPSQKVLGTLDIGLSQTVTVATLASIRNQMFIFTIMVLVVTIGGVTALLRRNVFLPMQKLEELTEKAETGKELPSVPSRLPRELDRIAKSYYNLNQKLHRTEQELSAAHGIGTTPATADSSR